MITKFMEKKPFIMAHRIVNNAVDTKEKVAGLLAKLDAKGIRGVEFDARQTKDKKFIAFHNSRFPQLKWPIEEYLFEDLKKDAEKNNFTFLTLQEVLLEIPATFKIQIDLKDKNVDAQKFLEAIAPFKIFDRVIISSFYPKVIKKFADSKIQARWLLTRISLKNELMRVIFYSFAPIQIAIICKATGVGPHRPLATKIIIKEAHRKKLTVTVWTIHKKKSLSKFKKRDADYLTVDSRLLV